MMQATTVFLWTSKPQQRSRITSMTLTLKCTERSLEGVSAVIAIFMAAKIVWFLIAGNNDAEAIVSHIPRFCYET